ncbi:MAG: hypothetical protein ACREP7_02885 [Lysobacter sp.]
MSGVALIGALLCAVQGLALGFACARIRIAGMATTAVATTIGVTLNSSATSVPLIALSIASMAAAIACAASMQLRALRSAHFALPLAFAIGACCGVSAATHGNAPEALRALPCLLLALPAAYCIRRGAGIAVKVVCSWLLAVTLLAASLPLLPVTPGYLPDHLQ